MSGLRAEGLTVVRGRHPALAQVDVHCPPGQLTALLGGNGAGKSTLLSAFAGDLAPTQGQVSLNDRPLRAWKDAALARQRAVLSQHLQVALPFTALEVVCLGRLPWGDGARYEAPARAALEAAGAHHLTHRPCTALSGGELQRVLLAKALVQLQGEPPHGPPALLLDEPTSAQDLAGQHRIMAQAQAQARAGATVVAVIHDPNLALRYAQRVVVLRRGRVLAQGPTQAVLTPETLSTAYGLPVAMTAHASGAWIAPRDTLA